MTSVINNGVPLVNGMLCGWADIVVLIGGVPITGIIGVEYNDDQEIVNKYGAGRYPVGRSKGRITCEGKLILYQEEVQALSAQSPNGGFRICPQALEPWKPRRVSFSVSFVCNQRPCDGEESDNTGDKQPPANNVDQNHKNNM